MPSQTPTATVEPYYNPETLCKTLQAGDRVVTIQQLNKTNIEQYLDKLAPIFLRYTIFYRSNHTLEQCKAFLLRRTQLTASNIFFALLHPPQQLEEQSEQLEASNDQDNLIPIGFAHVFPIWSCVNLEENFLLNDLYIDEEYRDLRIGSKLIQTVLDWGESTGAYYMNIETTLHNPRAQHLYPKMGFVEFLRRADTISYSYTYPIGKLRTYATYYE